MKRFVLTRLAKDDLHQIKNHLAARAGPAIARRVIKEIHSAMDAGHVREDLTNRPLKFWAVFSYLIVYTPSSRPIRVVRVLHGAQDVAHLL